MIVANDHIAGRRENLGPQSCPAGGEEARHFHDSKWRNKKPWFFRPSRARSAKTMPEKSGAGRRARVWNRFAPWHDRGRRLFLREVGLRPNAASAWPLRLDSCFLRRANRPPHGGKCSTKEGDPRPKVCRLSLRGTVYKRACNQFLPRWVLLAPRFRRLMARKTYFRHQTVFPTINHFFRRRRETPLVEHSRNADVPRARQRLAACQPEGYEGRAPVERSWLRLKKKGTDRPFHSLSVFEKNRHHDDGGFLLFARPTVFRFSLTRRLQAP